MTPAAGTPAHPAFRAPAGCGPHAAPPRAWPPHPPSPPRPSAPLPADAGAVVTVPASTRWLADGEWRSGPRDDPHGAGTLRGKLDRGLVPLVPYHRWANRGPSTMRVWMPAGN